jgi:hypothetical protein
MSNDGIAIGANELGDFPRERRAVRRWEPRLAGASVQDVIQLEFLSLVLAAPLLPPGRARALAAGGAIAGGLALAALRAGGEQPMSTLPAGFLAMQGALFVLGAGLGIGAAVAAWESGGSRRPAGAVLSVVGGIGLGLSCVPYLHAADFVPLLAAAVATAAVGFVLAWGAARLGSSSGASQGVCTRRGGLALIGAGVLLATISPWAGPILLGAMVTAAGGWVCAGARGARRLPIAPLLTLTLVPAWWLMRTIARPEGLATAWLPDLPWSPAAEQLLGALLLLAAWAMSGLWPLQRQEPAALTAPVAALLMARVALPAFPDGLEHWRALVMPVVLVGGLHGMLTGNRSAALAGLAWVGIATAIGPGQAGAGLVLLAGVIFLAAERLGTRLEVAAQLLATLAAGSGALLVTEAGLRTEVVYTVGAVAGLVGFAGRWGAAQASTASALRATLPSV